MRGYGVAGLRVCGSSVLVGVCPCRSVSVRVSVFEPADLHNFLIHNSYFLLSSCGSSVLVGVCPCRSVSVRVSVFGATGVRESPSMRPDGLETLEKVCRCPYVGDETRRLSRCLDRLVRLAKSFLRIIQCLENRLVDRPRLELLIKQAGILPDQPILVVSF